MARARIRAPEMEPVRVDRVREARGDNEGYDRGYMQCRRDVAAALGLRLAGPARSPQDEDHECDCPPNPHNGNDHTDACLAQQAVQVLVNDARTVLVNIWSTGEAEVAFRDDPGAMWGPPIRVAEDA